MAFGSEVYDAIYVVLLNNGCNSLIISDVGAMEAIVGQIGHIGHVGRITAISQSVEVNNQIVESTENYDEDNGITAQELIDKLSKY